MEAENADAKRQKVATGRAAKRKNPLQPTEAYRSYRVRMHPTRTQRQALRQWFAAGRWAYNAMVAAVRDGRLSPHQTSCKELMQDPAMPAWVKAVHATIRKNAMMEAVTAVQGNLTKQKKNPNHRFSLRFRSLRPQHTPSETLQLDAAQFDPQRGPLPKDTGPVMRILPVPGPDGQPRPRAHVFLGGTMRELGPVVVRDRRWLIDRMVSDRYLLTAGRLVWDKRRQTFDLIVQLRVMRPVDPDPEANDRRVVAMDPGSRRFQTFYDPQNGQHGVLCTGYCGQRSAAEELERRCLKLDRMRSRIDRRGWNNPSTRAHPPGKRVRRAWHAHQRGELSHAQYAQCLHRAEHAAYRRAQRHWRRELVRLHDLKHDMHYAAINFLWQRWDTVIASTASFGEMCRNSGSRPFGSRVARRALSWAHYAFRQRLVSSAFRRAGKYVIETEEPFTTQTCGLCGVRNPNVGDATVFRCVNATCGVHLDRDVNGARNICLLVLTKLMGHSSDA